MSQRHPVAVLGQPASRALDRPRVRVDREQPPDWFGGLQDPGGVPSAADGRIDLEAARSGRESQDDLLYQHGQVPYFRSFPMRSPRRSVRTLEAHMVQMPSPWRCSASSSGWSIRALKALHAAGDQSSRWSREPTTTASDLEAGELPEDGRHDQPTLAIELDLERRPEQEPLEGAGTFAGDRKSRGLGRELIPCGAGEQRQTAVDPLAHHRPLREVRTETHRDGHPSLIVDRVVVLPCEHRAGFAPTVVTSLAVAAGTVPTPGPPSDRLRSPPSRPTGPLGGVPSPILPTSHHFTPLGCAS